MLQLIRKYTFLLILLLFSVALFAQPVNFEVAAPNIVAKGEVFKVEYIIDVKPEIEEFIFTSPKITEFDVIAGPTEFRTSKTTIINGQLTQSTEIIYTYVLSGAKEGLLEIPSATVKINGKIHTSEALKVEVVGDDVKNKSGSKINDDDIIVRVTTNKRQVYKGEPIKVTIQLYARIPLTIENSKFPSFNGFYVEQLDNPNAKPFRATLNSKVYTAVTLREVLLFPQQSGVLKIEQTNINVIAQILTQATRQQSAFDNFYGNTMDVVEVHKKISAPPLEIIVNEFPEGAPASFNGAVGDYRIKSHVPTREIVANSSIAFTLEISGVGNLPLLQVPKLELPNSFEQYSVKITENFRVVNNGISGYRRFEYPVIARAEGVYDLEPIDFTYFNPESSKYITIKTDNTIITVLADSTTTASSSIGAGALIGGLTKEEVEILGEDIRFIRIGESNLKDNRSIFIFSLGYFVAIFAILVSFILALLYLRKRITEMRNMVFVKGKRANKVALQRLKVASEHMKSDDQRGFYEEMLKALWGYMSDRLNIPGSNLTKDNVREGLIKRGISLDEINIFIDIISKCEYAQYSPATAGHMNEIYHSAVEKISKFESIIK